MKNLIKILRANSCSRSLVMNFVGAFLTSVLLLPSVTSAQTNPLFYRAFYPYASEDMNLKCIINSTDVTITDMSDRFMSVGSYKVPNAPHFFGYALWSGTVTPTNPLYSFDGYGPLFGPAYPAIPRGSWTCSRLYDRTGEYDDSDYFLNYIDQPKVTGSYDMSGIPTYTGHVAVGTRIGYTYDHSVLNNRTWTTIIDPVTRNSVWDHVISNDSDMCIGISVVRDETSTTDFYVLSQISSANPADSNEVSRFGVTRYKWVVGDNGHVVDWSNEYHLENYQLKPAGIGQITATGDILIIGNMVPTGGGNNSIFAITINNVGGMVTPLHRYGGYGGNANYDNIWANSLTSHNGANDQFLIAGYAIPHGETNKYPMIMPLDSYGASIACVVYHYKNFAMENQYQNGQFNCAKMFDQKDAEENGNTVSRIVAVGDIGYLSTYPGTSSAIMMNTATIYSTPTWTKVHKNDLRYGSGPTASSAKWFVAQGDEDIPNSLLGEYVYIGTQISSNGGGVSDGLSGSFQKTTGNSSECTATPYFVNIDYAGSDTIHYADLSTWGTDDELRTISTPNRAYPYYCDHSNPNLSYTVTYGKKGDETQVQTGAIEYAEIVLLNDKLSINYSSPTESTVTLLITNILGNVIDDQKISCKSGNCSFELNVKDLVSGTYFVSLISPNYSFTKNIVIVK